MGGKAKLRKGFFVFILALCGVTTNADAQAATVFGSMDLSAIASDNQCMLQTTVGLQRRSSRDRGAARLESLAVKANNVTADSVRFFGLHFDHHPQPGLDDWSQTDTVQLLCALAIVVMVDAVTLLSSCGENWIWHMPMLTFITVASLVYLGLVSMVRGEEDGRAWGLAWVLECSLSSDNLFVFHLIFQRYRLEGKAARSALVGGMYGAAVLRVIFILLFSELFQLDANEFRLKYVVDIVAGVVLLILGVLTLEQGDEQNDVDSWCCMKGFFSCCGIRSKLKDRKRDINMMTVIMMIAISDFWCALDSTIAKTGEVKSRYINISSTLMAMLFLRAWFFIVRDSYTSFEMNKYGICSILIVVGVELIASKWTRVPRGTTCVVIIAIMCVSVALSFIVSCSRSSECCTADLDEVAPETTPHVFPPKCKRNVPNIYAVVKAGQDAETTAAAAHKATQEAAAKAEEIPKAKAEEKMNKVKTAKDEIRTAKERAEALERDVGAVKEVLDGRREVLDAVKEVLDVDAVKEVKVRKREVLDGTMVAVQKAESASKVASEAVGKALEALDAACEAEADADAKQEQVDAAKKKCHVAFTDAIDKTKEAISAVEQLKLDAAKAATDDTVWDCLDSDNEEAANPQPLPVMSCCLFEAPKRIRPTVGDTVILKETADTQKYFKESDIGKRYVITEDEKDEQPYQVKGLEGFLREADVDFAPEDTFQRGGQANWDARAQKSPLLPV